MTAMTVPAPGTGGSVAAANAALADMGMTRPGGGRAGHQALAAWLEQVAASMAGQTSQPPGPPLSLTAPVTAGEGW
jgi:hypothetical protein